MRRSLIALTAVLAAPGSMAAVVFTDDFSSVTVNASVAPGWTVTGNTLWYLTDGVGGTSGGRLRHGAATAVKALDMEPHLGAHGMTIGIQFDAWVRSTNAQGTEEGRLAYTTNGVDWTTVWTLGLNDPDNIDYDLAGYLGPWSVSIDASSWTVTQQQNFAFRFEQTANHNVDNTHFDKVQVSVVPEPAAAGLLLIGAGALVLRRRQRD